MTVKVDWNIDRDPDNVKKRAVELRRYVAERIYTAPFLSPERARAFLKTQRTVWRNRAIEKVEIFLGHELRGQILEIGAGTGWCTALVSKKPDVEQVYALDYDEYSVDEIMPMVFKNLEANNEKITRALGSFNATALDDASMDAVIAIGAIHHSESLHATFTEAYRVLKSGGVLMAFEPCEPDSLTNAEQAQKDATALDPAIAAKLYGEDIGVIRESDNSDHSYRLVDFLAAALDTGFDAYPYTFDTIKAGRTDWDSYFQSRTCYNGFEKIIMPPYFADNNPKGEPVFDPLLLILRKP